MVFAARWLLAGALLVGFGATPALAAGTQGDPPAPQVLVLDKVLADRAQLAGLFTLPEAVERVRYVRHTQRRAGSQLPGTPGNALTAFIQWTEGPLPSEWGRVSPGGEVVLEAAFGRQLLPPKLLAEATDDETRLRLEATGTLSGAGLGLEGAQVARMLWFKGRGVWVELVAVPVPTALPEAPED